MEQRLIFNENEYLYDKYRPTYPDELFNEIFSYSKIDCNCKLLEIGIGTGQATLPFLRKGCHVTAIELGNRLSTLAKQKYCNYKNFQIINDDFLVSPIETNYFDLIYSATAFHWLPIPDSYKKVITYLKKGGIIALFWNHPFTNRINDISNMASNRIYEKYCPTKKKPHEFSEEDCQKQIDRLEYFGFKDIHYKLFYRTRILSANDYIRLLNTYSDHHILSSEMKTQFENDMRKELNQIGGNIHIYDTIDLYLAKKL